MQLRPSLAMAVALTPALGQLLAAAEPAPTSQPTTIFRSLQPIAVDGVLDEPAWKRAAVVEADYIWGQVGKRSAQPRMRARYTWDDQYFYIGYETMDKNLVALGTGEKEGPPENQREGGRISHDTEKVDVVEFFISFGDRRFFWEVHQTAANHFNDIWCVVVDPSWAISNSSMNRFGIQFHNREFVQDQADTGHTLAMAARPKPKADGKPSTMNDPSDVDTGYAGELRLPWFGLGAPLTRETWVPVEPAEPNARPRRKHGPWKMAGQEMLILAVTQDGDLKEHYHHSSPTKPGGWFHQGAEHWPRYVLAQ